jgi:hypothetical protein
MSGTNRGRLGGPGLAAAVALLAGGAVLRAGEPPPEPKGPFHVYIKAGEHGCFVRGPSLASVDEAFGAARKARQGGAAAVLVVAGADPQRLGDVSGCVVAVYRDDRSPRKGLRLAGVYASQPEAIAALLAGAQAGEGVEVVYVLPAKK